MFARNLFGTTEVGIDLALISTNISVSGGLFSPIYTIQYTDVHDNAAWSTIFDEYSFVHGTLTYEPVYQQSAGNATGGTQYLGVGAIDYDDNTPLTSVNQAVGYDTAKWFPMAPIQYHPTSWSFHFIGQPDKVWVDSANNSTPAFWKGISDQSPFAMGNVAVGRMHGRVLIKFRQVQ
jgi:hypothetical protein